MAPPRSAPHGRQNIVTTTVGRLRARTSRPSSTRIRHHRHGRLRPRRRDPRRPPRPTRPSSSSASTSHLRRQGDAVRHRPAPDARARQLPGPRSSTRRRPATSPASSPPAQQVGHIGAIGGIGTIPPVVNYIRATRTARSPSTPTPRSSKYVSDDMTAKAFNDPTSGKTFADQFIRRTATSTSSSRSPARPATACSRRPGSRHLRHRR